MIPRHHLLSSLTQSMSLFLLPRFYNLVLLPRIRDDIVEYKRLNFQLFMALKKSIFKPAAFFKGILLPLCEVSTTCVSCMIPDITPYNAFLSTL